MNTTKSKKCIMSTTNQIYFITCSLGQIPHAY